MSWHNGDYPTTTSLGDSDIFLGAQSGASVVFNGETLKDFIAAKSANILNVDSTLSGTDANTSEKVLFSYTLPAATLNVNGWFIRIIAWGTLASLGATKRITLRTTTPNTIINSFAADVENNWLLETKFIRLAAGNQDCISTITVRSGVDWGTPMSGLQSFREITENLNADITFQLVGENGAPIASEIRYEGSVILING